MNVTTDATATPDETISTLIEAIKLFQDCVERFDALAADVLQVNATDLRCLAILRDRGRLQAHEVASALGLTRGATTTALRRISSMGYISREERGRCVIVSLTDAGRVKVDALWAPIMRLGREHLEGYSCSEKALLLRFFEASITLQDKCSAILEQERRGMTRAEAVSSGLHRKRLPRPTTAAPGATPDGAVEALDGPGRRRSRRTHGSTPSRGPRNANAAPKAPA